ncbi:MAG: membrane dipeptidase, partial [Candidatus Obscuribacterales bacterium]|nr:membrane dipeptidase [Candidatus Obscuribacterales bacterium]
TKVPSHVAMENNHGDSDDITLLALVSKWPAASWTRLSERVLFQASKLREFARQSNGQLTIIRSATDLKDYLARRQKNAACTAGFLGIEGAHALDGDLKNIDAFFDAGVRMMAPTHFFDNDIGSSAHGLLHEGLTDKGKEMIRRMQAKHMIVDLAHASPRTIADALAISTAPVVVSHTGVKGTCDSVRNLSDEELTGIAKTGGVIGIGYWPEAICGNSAAAIAKAMRYTSKLVGVDHVGLGSDFDGTASVPFDSAHLIQVTQALIDEGFTDKEIRLIMGENAIRVLQATLPAN